MTRELFFADPRVEPTGRTRGSGRRIRLIQTYSCLPESSARRAGAPRAGPTDPTHGSENDTKLAASSTSFSRGDIPYSDRVIS